MTDEKKNILYNKTKEELTLKDKLYIKSVLNLKENNKNIILDATIVVGIGSALILFPLCWFYNQLLAIIILGSCATAAVGSAIYTAIEEIKKHYKQVGLTRKEYKDLVKSGRLEILQDMVKDVDYNTLNTLESKKEKLQDLTNNINIEKEEAKTLIQKMIKEKQITQQEADVYLNDKKSTNVIDNETVEIEDNIIGV